MHICYLLHIIMYFRRGRPLTSLVMFKIVFVILFVCKFSSGFQTTELKEFHRNVRNLSLELFRFTVQDTKSHVVMAPYTIWNLISLVAFTASAESWNQFYSVMGYPKGKEQYINSFYNITNSFLKRGVGALFETKLIVFYDAKIELSQSFKKSIVDSGAHLRKLYFDENVLSSILANDNIRQPDDFLLKVFNEADFEESSVIVSGIVEFTGNWTSPFLKSNTVLRDGYNGSFYMMRQRARVLYDDIEMLSASAMVLSYGDISDYKMLIIRPHENVQIESVIRKLAEMSLADTLYQLYRQGYKEMHVELPKFSLKSVLILNNPFKSMGVVDVFVPEKANFSELTTSEDMYIFNIEQRTSFMVSETGTVARAFTPGNIAKGTRKSESGMAPPFLFFIVHIRSMTIVFCGKYGE